MWKRKDMVKRKGRKGWRDKVKKRKEMQCKGKGRRGGVRLGEVMVEEREEEIKKREQRVWEKRVNDKRKDSLGDKGMDTRKFTSLLDNQ